MQGLEAKIRLTLESKNVASKLTKILKDAQRRSEAVYRSTSKWTPELRKATTQASKLKKELDKNSSVVDGIGKKLKGLFASSS